MLITHKISLDMLQPQTPERIQVKQGDAMTRGLQILLFSGGEPWPIPADVTPLVRWCASDPDTGEAASGIYDTLPDGSHAWNYTQNQLDLILAPQMFSLPGLVQADVALVSNDKTLATFNFEFYVNPVPVDGSSPQAQSWYKVATLDQLNTQLTHLETLITELREDMDEEMDQLEHRIYGLERIVNQT